MNLDGAIQALKMYENGIVDVPGADARLEGGMLAAADGRFMLTDAGFDRLVARVGAPRGYLRSLDQDLSELLLQRHIEQGDLGDATLVVRGGKLVGITDPHLLRLSGVEALEAVAEVADRPEELEVERFDLSDTSVEIDLLKRSGTTEVAPGDVLKAGLRLRHSLVGEYATSIDFFVIRLLCLNGMTHRECGGRGASRTRRLPVGHPDARRLQQDQVRRLAAQAWSALDDKLATLRRLRNEPTDVERLLERWLSRARMSSRRLLRLLREDWEREGSAPTVYAAVNALTRAGTHRQQLSIRERRTLCGLGGLLAFHSRHVCPRCFALLGEGGAA
jgi:hypothetical protein